MRICYLAPAESSHMLKWTEHMSKRGHDVHVISFRRGDLPHATVHYLGAEVGRQESDFRKLSYLGTVGKARRIIKQLNPDILHAHYASSYGLLAALSCNKPYYLSVWGADVYDFPRKSPLHNIAIRFVFSKASWLMSTSAVMAEEASTYTNKSFDITPFGVDMELFHPKRRTRLVGDGHFVIGTVKALEPKYGIDVLLKGAAFALKTRPDIPLQVRIAGRGSQKEELKALSQELGIAERVEWLGFISQVQAAQEWANMDVAIVMSERESESFGVSSVEAQASGTPVIYSDIPGLMEAADGGSKGVCIKRGDTKALASELIRFYDDVELRTKLGREGRDFVSEAFEADSCFEKVETIYCRNINVEGEANY